MTKESQRKQRTVPDKLGRVQRNIDINLQVLRAVEREMKRRNIASRNDLINELLRLGLEKSLTMPGLDDFDATGETNESTEEKEGIRQLIAGVV